MIRTDKITHNMNSIKTKTFDLYSLVPIGSKLSE